MTLRATYTAVDYNASKVVSRYVRRSEAEGLYRFCEVGEDTRFDIRQGTVDADDLPEAVRLAADRRKSEFPAYVVWPLNQGGAS